MTYTKSFLPSALLKSVSLLTSAAVILQSVSSYALEVLPAVNAQAVLPEFILGARCNGLLPQGLTIDPSQPFQFNLLVHNPDGYLDDATLRAESQKLVKYFLASVAIPGNQLWVNLGPQDRDRMLTPAFAATDMGKDLLIQDYWLKTLSTQATNPESETGKIFWDTLYQKIYETYGSVDMPVESFQRVWIVPASADVVVNGRSAYITDAHLKVMLESDYLRQWKSSDNKTDLDAGSVQLNDIYTKVMRETVIPYLEQRVNEGEEFINLRQIYRALILAVWFKNKLKRTLFAQIYADQGRVDGIALDGDGWKEQVFEKYLDNFKSGVYSVIKESYDPEQQDLITRNYFSGGVDYMKTSSAVNFYEPSVAMPSLLPAFGDVYSVQTEVVGNSPAMLALPGMKKIFLGVLVALAFMMATQSAQAANYSRDGQGHLVVKIEKGDQLGKIALDVKHAAGMDGNVWDKGGAYDLVLENMTGDQNLKPGNILIINTNGNESLGGAAGVLAPQNLDTDPDVPFGTPSLPQRYADNGSEGNDLDQSGDSTQASTDVAPSADSLWGKSLESVSPEMGAAIGVQKPEDWKAPESNSVMTFFLILSLSFAAAFTSLKALKSRKRKALSESILTAPIVNLSETRQPLDFLQGVATTLTATDAMPASPFASQAVVDISQEDHMPVEADVHNGALYGVATDLTGTQSMPASPFVLNAPPDSNDLWVEAEPNLSREEHYSNNITSGYHFSGWTVSTTEHSGPQLSDGPTRYQPDVRELPSSNLETANVRTDRPEAVFSAPLMGISTPQTGFEGMPESPFSSSDRVVLADVPVNHEAAFSGRLRWYMFMNLLISLAFLSAAVILMINHNPGVLLGCGNFGFFWMPPKIIRRSQFAHMTNGDQIFNVISGRWLKDSNEEAGLLFRNIVLIEKDIRVIFNGEADEILSILHGTPAVNTKGFRALFPKWAEKAADDIVRQLSTRGGQSEGINLFYKDGSASGSVSAKHVKGKRFALSLSQGTLKKLRRDIRRAAFKAVIKIPVWVMPKKFQVTESDGALELRWYAVFGLTGHVRFTTFSAVTEPGSHPHEYREKRTNWSPKEFGEKTILSSETGEDIVSVTHNGDNDGIELAFGGQAENMEYLDFVSMESFFTRMMGFERYRFPEYVDEETGELIDPNADYDAYHEKFRKDFPGVRPPTIKKSNSYPYSYFMKKGDGTVQKISKGDSPLVALEMAFFITQGNWKASARLAHTLEMNNSLAEAERNMLNPGDWDVIGTFFDRVFEVLATDEKYRDYLAKLFDSKIAFSGDEGLKHIFVEAIKAERVRDSQAGRLMSSWKEDHLDAFTNRMLESFFRSDRERGVKEFQPKADGAFGLVVRTSIGKDTGVTMMAMGQPLAYGFNEDRSLFAYASDHTSLLTNFGPHGPLQEVILLNPGERGQVANLDFDPANHLQLSTRIYDFEKQRELHRDEIIEQSYPLSTDNPYFEPLVSYNDPDNLVEEDLQRMPHDLQKLMQTWDDPESFNSRTSEALFQKLLAKYLTSMVRERSAAYVKLRPRLLEQIRGELRSLLQARNFQGDREVFIHHLTERITNETVFVEYATSRLDDIVLGWSRTLAARAAQDPNVMKNELFREIESLDGQLGNLTRNLIPEIVGVMADLLKPAISQQLNGTVITDGTASEWLDRLVTKLNDKKVPFKPTPKNKVDLLISGYSDSDSIDQNPAEIFQKIFPDLKILAINSNDLLRNQEMVGSETIVILTSKSGGQTFATGALVGILKKITPGNIFGSVGRPDSLMSVSLGQKLLPNVGKIDRMFVTGNTYPAESNTVSEVLMYAQQLKMVERIAERMSNTFTALKPFGMKLTRKNVEFLKEQNRQLVQQTEMLSGITADYKAMESSSYKSILARASRLSLKIQESFFALKAVIAYIGYSVVLGPFGFPTFGTIVTWMVSLSGWAGSFVGISMVGVLHAVFYIGLGWMATIGYRMWYGLPLWSRLGVQPTTISEKGYFALMHELLLSKLGSQSLPWMSMAVYSGDGRSEIPAKFAHRVARGGNIYSAMPIDESQAAFKTTLSQSKNITNYMWGGLSRWFPNFLLGGPEVTTVGKGKFMKPNMNNFHISTGDVPQEILDIIAKINGKMPVTDEERRQVEIYTFTADEFSRFVVFKQLFARAYLPFKEKWNIAESFPRIGVHSTRSSEVPRYPYVISSREYFEKLQVRSKENLLEKVSNAMLELNQNIEPGGIDLDPAKWMLKETNLTNPSTEEDKAMLQNLRTMPGMFIPVIIGIDPIKTEAQLSALTGFGSTLASAVGN